MIVAEQKPIEEIIQSLEGYSNIILAACGTCVTVCMAGGEKEALDLAALLSARSSEQKHDINIQVIAPKRQCDSEFLEEFGTQIEQADVVLSMACGAGVQFMAQIFPEKIILPALNTKFIGVTQDVGIWTEMCQGCGDCILEKTGGVCPVARCSKSNFNGPCGGSENGKCEVSPDIDCGWQLIYNRLKKIGKLENLYEIIEPKNWSTSRDGGPRRVVKEAGE
ncbi:methylenetetrahydrofolate reductase C-terminal domain-containing protein [Bacillota bacterium LX-D]|nr:methylenetetrahydrofolate reductase C-terminal domain-containing protein [Bacillota bacterium LX-D]